MSAGRLALAALIVAIVAIVVLVLRGGRRDKYSAGYQIDPHYSGETTWAGVPYVFAGKPPCAEKFASPEAEFPPETISPLASPDEGPRGVNDFPSLVYTPAFTRSELQTNSWWRPDGGTDSMPPAAERPDFWAGDLTLRTYHSKSAIPQHCDEASVVSRDRPATAAERDAKWRYYGGPKGWRMSPYY